MDIILEIVNTYLRGIFMFGLFLVNKKCGFRKLSSFYTFIIFKLKLWSTPFSQMIEILIKTYTTQTAAVFSSCKILARSMFPFGVEYLNIQYMAIFIDHFVAQFGYLPTKLCE